jgi:acetyl esterase/lipase
MPRRLPPALATLLLVALTGADIPVPQQSAAPPAPTVFEAVTYRTIDDRPLKLDLAVPPGDGPFPVIVMLHGGGWIKGDRSRFRDEIEEAAWRGFVGVTVSYRLCKTGEDTPSVDGFPSPVQDVKAAIRFLRANAGQFNIDSDRIGIGGESAGGHIALLVGLTRPQDGLDGDVPADAPSSEVQAVANVFGPTDLAALARDNPSSRILLVMLLGAAPELAPERYWEASPTSYVRRDAPPVLTIHGTADGLVPVGQARRLDAAMKKAGARHELMILYGSGHGFGGVHALRTQRAFYDFFERTLKRP